MKLPSGKIYDIQAYLANDAIRVNAFELCQELEKLSSDAISQLYELLGAEWDVQRQIDNAYWDGYLKGREETREEAYQQGLIDGEDNIKLEDFTPAMLIEELKRQGIIEP